MRTRSLGFAVAFVVRLGADRQSPQGPRRAPRSKAFSSARRESRPRLSQVSPSALLKRRRGVREPTIKRGLERADFRTDPDRLLSLADNPRRPHPADTPKLPKSKESDV